MESSAFERRLRITSVRVEAKGNFQVHDEERDNDGLGTNETKVYHGLRER